MKAYKLIFCFLISNFLYANEIDDIKNDYYIDNESYIQFLDLGKSICLDNVLKKQIGDEFKSDYFSEKHYQTLFSLNSKLKRYYKWRDLKIILDDFYKKNIDNHIKKYKTKDEYFKLSYSSPLFICNTLFSESAELKNLYNEFIDKYNLLNK
ncbi:hypothetical protein B0186_09980 [Canicola haemoglobinophilus]|uniref:Uncharacterized protein n=1 Tax=Canicola haemoglobinophilus TaxID=733 RepID=A0A1V4AYW9_9PAST|nr:hypothetical protein [Canicola haemoglobinophilus]OOR98019.1 hypothetical protein B0186_09980 [Canicola haemoglobinophilus]STO54008.1 Uncharacterised protein [Canicola haemoglobinophilus]STO60558.1 Uncharacterised protein [Canicola haemoglobinophilus]STO68541.1 Uncharacterised protein [Canicola haemoglobinophilus]